MYQRSCRDAFLPLDVRLAFVKKVYGILMLMLIVSFGISCPFVFARDATLKWFFHHSWVLVIISVILIAQYVANTCMACEMCFGGSSMLLAYLGMLKTVPLNYIYLFTFSAAFGVLVGFTCAAYTAESVVFIFALSAMLVAALTGYAVKTKADFSGFGPYILIGLMGLMMMITVTMFFPGRMLTRFIGAAGAMLFACIIVMDTQAIFGSAAQDFGGGMRTFEYTVDMYAFAAFNLYLDFINFFLFMIQLLGERRE